MLGPLKMKIKNVRVLTTYNHYKEINLIYKDRNVHLVITFLWIWFENSELNTANTHTASQNSFIFYAKTLST
jgi:hypothetical protein